MDIKELVTKTQGWLRGKRIAKLRDYSPAVDTDGLLNEEGKSGGGAAGPETGERNEVVVKTVAPKDRGESLEKLQDGFSKLVGQLEGINEHLTRQANQHEELMSRIDHLPKLLESFPAIVEGQKQLSEQLFEQLKGSAIKNDQFIDAVEKIPVETAKQTDALAQIDHQLAAAADTDVQMTETFNKFNEALGKLNEVTEGQTDGIMQMSKTFATSDRYMKYLVSRQNKRFMWIFSTAVIVCVVVILILTGIIIYLKQ